MSTSEVIISIAAIAGPIASIVVILLSNRNARKKVELEYQKKRSELALEKMMELPIKILEFERGRQHKEFVNFTRFSESYNLIWQSMAVYGGKGSVILANELQILTRKLDLREAFMKHVEKEKIPLPDYQKEVHDQVSLASALLLLSLCQTKYEVTGIKISAELMLQITQPDIDDLPEIKTLVKAHVNRLVNTLKLSIEFKFS